MQSSILSTVSDLHTTSRPRSRASNLFRRFSLRARRSLLSSPNKKNSGSGSGSRDRTASSDPTLTSLRQKTQLLRRQSQSHFWSLGHRLTGEWLRHQRTQGGGGGGHSQTSVESEMELVSSGRILHQIETQDHNLLYSGGGADVDLAEDGCEFPLHFSGVFDDALSSLQMRTASSSSGSRSSPSRRRRSRAGAGAGGTDVAPAPRDRQHVLKSYSISKEVGHALFALGSYSDAKRHFEKAASESMDLGHLQSSLDSYSWIVRCCIGLRDWERIRQIEWEKIRGIYEKVFVPFADKGVREAYLVILLVELLLRKWDRVVSVKEELLKVLSREMDNPNVLCDFVNDFVWVCRFEGGDQVGQWLSQEREPVKELFSDPIQKDLLGFVRKSYRKSLGADL